MADTSTERTGPTFPPFVLGGILAMVVLAVVAGVAIDWSWAIAILILTALCVGVALFYRLMAGKGSESNPQGGLPKLPTDAGRPLGDTQEAHDEINPHDFPADSPGRKPAEAMASGEGGTTGGMSQGGAAGDGGSEERAPVPDEENREGADVR